MDPHNSFSPLSNVGGVFCLFDIARQLPVLTNPVTISMPQLSFEKIKYLPAVMHESNELQYQLGSQGQFVSPDGTYAYSHDSSYPEVYFTKAERLPCAVNMDRGAVLTRVDGTRVACIADGLSSEGYFSAFVAQGLCQSVLNQLSEKSVGFGSNETINKQIVEKLFNDSLLSLSTLKDCGLSGSSTILFAECVPTNQNRVYKLCVGALGDGAAIHINSREKKATQVNTIHRELDSKGIPDVSSTGGSIDIRGGMWDKQYIEANIIEIDEDDYVVLVTDGFLDNVRGNRISEMVELVAYHPFFDQPFDKLFKYARFWEPAIRPTLPTVEQMKTFIETNNGIGMIPDEKLTAEKIMQRLAAYTTLVTCSYRLKEEKHYAEFASHPGFDSNTPKTDDAMIIAMSPAASKR